MDLAGNLEVYEIDAILRKRIIRGNSEYLVHWKGYPNKDNSWVPAQNMHCPQLMAAFEEKQKEIPKKTKQNL